MREREKREKKERKREKKERKREEEKKRRDINNIKSLELKKITTIIPLITNIHVKTLLNTLHVQVHVYNVWSLKIH